MKDVAIPVEVQRQAQIELVKRMRFAHPMHPTPLQMAQRVQEAADLLKGGRLEFFLQPKHSLSGLTPLEALASGLHLGVRDCALVFRPEAH